MLTTLFLKWIFEYIKPKFNDFKYGYLNLICRGPINELHSKTILFDW